MTAPSPSTAGTFRFGVFTLDARTGVLDGPHGRANLPDQPLKILLALLERPGEPVTREELRQRLWPDNTFVDFEHGLNAAVKRLRDALGDSADAPQFIETVPRRGYRFIAPVEAPGQPRHARPAGPAATDTPPSPARGRRVQASLVVVALLAGTAAGWYALSPASERDTPGASVARGLTRVTFGTGLDTDATWSPDGRRIAYASDRSGNFDIWIQSIDGGDATRVTTSPASDVEPAWSPDGASIAFRSERDGGGIYVASARGGIARRLTTLGAHPMWMPGSREVFVGVGLGRGATRAYLVPASGGEPPREILAAFLEAGTWEWIAPHPDGRLSALGWHRATGFGFYTLRPDGEALVAVSPPGAFIESISGQALHQDRRFVWSPRGDTLYVQTAASEIETLWRIRVAPRTLEWRSVERLTTGADHADAPAISTDGTRIALSAQRRVSRAWVFPFDPAAGRLEGDGRPITAEDVSVIWPSLSRDGGALLYSAQRSGTEDVDALETSLETGETRILARGARGPLPSPGGTRYLYLLTRSRPRGDAPPAVAGAVEYALGLRDSTGSEHLLTPWSDRVRIFPSEWTADGRALFGTYCPTTCNTGPVALATWPVTGDERLGPARILLREDGRRFWQASHSPDRRAITFVAERPDRPDRLEMGLMPAEGPSPSGWTRLAADHRWPDKPRWAPDGRTVYFLSREPAGYFNVWGVRVDASSATAAGTPFQVTTLSSPSLMIDPNIFLSEMDVRGRRLLLMLASARGNIWVLSNADR